MTKKDNDISSEKQISDEDDFDTFLKSIENMDPKRPESCFRTL